MRYEGWGDCTLKIKWRRRRYGEDGEFFDEDTDEDFDFDEENGNSPLKFNRL